MSSGITIVNIKDKPTPKYDVYIGRANKYLNLPASKWGNPFVLKSEQGRQAVLEAYRKHILASPALLAALPELKGKILGCYCSPKKCHGEVLKDLLDQILKRGTSDEV